jgi:ABC-type phosphate transport system substrate-binding protein
VPERNSLSSIRSRFGGLKTIKPSLKLTAALVGVAAVVPALLAPAAASATTNFYGSGSSAAQSYVNALFAGYEKSHPSIRFHYNSDGGNAGVTDVVNGNASFAIQTAAPSATKKPTEWGKLFLDALCIDVNSKNAISNVSESAVQGIFQSNPLYNSWNQVPAASGNASSLGSQTILAEGRNSAAGQYTFFVQEILKGGSENQSVTQESTDGEVKVQIQTHANAIGYVGLANSVGKTEKALELNGVPCTSKYVANKKYPLWRWDWVVLPASPNPQLVAFFDWVTDSTAAAKIINQAGAVASRHALHL